MEPATVSDGLLKRKTNVHGFAMIGRLFRLFFFFALIALVIHRLCSRRQKRTLREIASISAWVLLGAAAATLFWYLVMLYFKHIPDSY